MVSGVFHPGGKPKGMHISPQCEHCKGAGYMRITLAMSRSALSKLSELAKLLPNEPIPVDREVCPHCSGTGRYG